MTKHKFEHQDMAETEFIDINLHKARFDNVNMGEVFIKNANLHNAVIDDANIQGMTIFGIRIDQLIAAELDRRDPTRVTLRLKDPHDIAEVRRVISVLNQLRADFVTHLNSVPADILNNHPGPDRWSALEHIRHLVFAEELYLNWWILRNTEPLSPLGFLPPFLYDNPDYTNVGKAPTEDLHQVLDAWHAVHQTMEAWLAGADAADLQTNIQDVSFGQRTIGDALQTLASHDLEHIRMAERAIEDSIHL